MSIVNIKAYSIKCDECGRQYEGDEFSMWGDVDGAVDDACNSGWICYHEDRPENHYCPDCAEEDKDGNLLFLKHEENIQVRAGIATKRPWGFCVTKNSTCTMNYCDDNGCIDRKSKNNEGDEVKLTPKPNEHI